MNPVPENFPDPDSDPTELSSIDEIIEDLTQQDYMPSDNGSIEVPEDPIAGGLDDSGRWDEPIGERGHRSHIESPVDEATDAEQLVNDGLKEADEELREYDEETLEEDLDDEEITEDVIKSGDPELP